MPNKVIISNKNIASNSSFAYNSTIDNVNQDKYHLKGITRFSSRKDDENNLVSSNIIKASNNKFTSIDNYKIDEKCLSRTQSQSRPVRKMFR